MKNLIYLLFLVLITLSTTFCDDIYDEIDEFEVLDDSVLVYDDTVKVYNDSLIIQIIHDADSAMHGGVAGYNDMYWHFDTLYIMNFDHHGYYNDWHFDEDSCSWEYPENKYHRFLRDDEMLFKCKRDSSYSLHLGYIIIEYSYDQLFYSSGYWINTHTIEDTIKLYLSDYTPAY